MGRLSGKVALVTGAGEGIGRSIAERFLEEDATVGMLDFNEQLVSRTAAELGDGRADRVVAVTADVSNAEQVADAVARVAQLLGPPTVLVNNAGAFEFKGIEATAEEWHAVLDVNVLGPALVAQHTVPHMQRAGGGAIVNLGSVSGMIAQRGFLTYCASKAAVIEMTRCMALDLAEDGIRVNAVSPGGVWSASVERYASERGWTRETAGSQPNLGLETMLGRPADPREVANAILFLASDESSYVTGANLMVDAGWTAL
jgi:dihydroanticapsin dehydrogenase